MKSRFIIVSNRLPIVASQNENGDWQIKSGSGGLVTAMAPVLKNRGGTWMGWSGTVTEKSRGLEKVLSAETNKFGYSLKPVNLTLQEKENYYEGFANQVIWPLFHDFAANCNFEPDYWTAYQQVNSKFATELMTALHDTDFIWVHDYHLMMVARILREMGLKARIAFFLHIPFPPLDIFIRLPWRFQILRALLEYDLVGFQTLRDRRNFIQCVSTLIPEVRISGRGQVISLRFEKRQIRIGAFAISIDYKDFAKTAATDKVSEKARFIHQGLTGQQIILGIDRLDYSKGILERLKAYREALKSFPELQHKTTFVQVVVPSRRGIPQYADLKQEIERLVGEINGQYTRSGWVPIHYIFRSLERSELLAYYRTAEIALLTALKDGMNLVAKEYCACNIEENGVLIMSEFAGAAAQFQKQALLVNPHDIKSVAETIYHAFKMEVGERKARMQNLRRSVRRSDIFWWVDAFLKAAFAKNLDDFPLLQDYVPQERFGPETEVTTA